jgi:type IV pilus assembly protein PilE
MTKTSQKGFSLIELVMVITIVGILMAVAIPSYKSSTAKARRSDGQTALMDAMTREERYFTEHNTYTTNLATASAATTSQEGYYTISAAACGAGISSCVKLTATAGSVQASDGNLTLDSRGQKLPADKW